MVVELKDALTAQDAPVPIVRVVVTFLLALADEVCRTVTESPLLTAPAAEVQLLPLPIRYSLPAAPLTEIAVAELMPETVIVFEVMVFFVFTFVWSTKLNGSAQMSRGWVVTLNVPETPPMISVAVTIVEKLPDEVSLIWTVCPLVIVPAADVKAPPLIEYVPPLTEMAVAVLMPEMVTVFEVTGVLSATPVCAVKLNAAGVVSAGIVVLVKVPVTPPTVSVVVVAVSTVAADVCRTLTVCPVVRVPGADV